MNATSSCDQALAALGVSDNTLTPEETEALDRDGVVLLRGLIARELLPMLRRQFDDAVLPLDVWPYPRARGIHYAMLKNNPAFLNICLSPRLLAGASRMFGRRFFLAAFEGRAPDRDGGAQELHRDCLEPPGPTHSVSLLAFLDDFGPKNGATRLIPGSHIQDMPQPYSDPHEIVIEGKAGDALLFNSRLVHGGTCNTSGDHRRTLIAAYLGQEQYAGRYFKLEAPPSACISTRYMLGEY